MVTRHHLLLLSALFVVQSLNIMARSSGPGVAAKVAVGTSASKGEEASVLKPKRSVSDSSQSPKTTQKPATKSKKAAVDNSKATKSSQKQTTGTCGSDCSCWR